MKKKNIQQFGHKILNSLGNYIDPTNAKKEKSQTIKNETSIANYIKDDIFIDNIMEYMVLPNYMNKFLSSIIRKRNQSIRKEDYDVEYYYNIINNEENKYLIGSIDFNYRDLVYKYLTEGQNSIEFLEKLRKQLLELNKIFIKTKEKHIRNIERHRKNKNIDLFLDAYRNLYIDYEDFTYKFVINSISEEYNEHAGYKGYKEGYKKKKENVYSNLIKFLDSQIEENIKKAEKLERRNITMEENITKKIMQYKEEISKLEIEKDIYKDINRKDTQPEYITEKENKIKNIDKKIKELNGKIYTLEHPEQFSEELFGKRKFKRRLAVFGTKITKRF